MAMLKALRTRTSLKKFLPLGAYFNSSLPKSKPKNKPTAEAAPIADRFLVLAPKLSITSSDDYVFAGQVLDEIKGRWKALEARRIEITAPLNAGLKSANDLFRGPLDTLKTNWMADDPQFNPDGQKDLPA